MDVTVGNQICALYVDWGIISLKMIRKWTLQIRKFNGTPKILKLVRIYQ